MHSNYFGQDRKIIPITTYAKIFLSNSKNLHSNLIGERDFVSSSLTFKKVLFQRLIKHEYLRSHAYICLSLSSPFPSVKFSQIWPLSRYSCFYLGSLHPRNFRKKINQSHVSLLEKWSTYKISKTISFLICEKRLS